MLYHIKEALLEDIVYRKHLLKSDDKVNTLMALHKVKNWLCSDEKETWAKLIRDLCEYSFYHGAGINIENRNSEELPMTVKWEIDLDDVEIMATTNPLTVVDNQLIQTTIIGNDRRMCNIPLSLLGIGRNNNRYITNVSTRNDIATIYMSDGFNYEITLRQIDDLVSRISGNTNNQLKLDSLGKLLVEPINVLVDAFGKPLNFKGF